MRRKVIQIADSTQLISLPRKWALQNNIKKGDELEVEVNGKKILISTDSSPPFSSMQVDVSKLERTSIVFLIRALYKKGYDEIRINYNTPTAHHYRTEKDVNVSTVIHQEVSRCPGLEVIEQKDNYFLLKAISVADPKELDNILRRTFILILDTNKDFVNACKINDRPLLESIEEKHDNATRFLNHSCRLITKRQSDSSTSHFLYTIVSMLDKILDVMKDGARYMLVYNKKIRPETAKILDFMCNSYETFYELFYKFNLDKVHQMNEDRERIHQEVQNTKNIPKEEIQLLYDMHQSLELYRALTESRMAMEF